MGSILLLSVNVCYQILHPKYASSVPLKILRVRLVKNCEVIIEINSIYFSLKIHYVFLIYSPLTTLGMSIASAIEYIVVVYIQTNLKVLKKVNAYHYKLSFSNLLSNIPSSHFDLEHVIIIFSIWIAGSPSLLFKIRRTYQIFIHLISCKSCEEILSKVRHIKTFFCIEVSEENLLFKENIAKENF